MFLFFYIKIDVNEEFLHPHQKLYNPFMSVLFSLFLFNGRATNYLVEGTFFIKLR